jgi:hypothetical protein
VERENAFFKSSPVDEYHLPQMNSKKVFLGVRFFFSHVENILSNEHKLKVVLEQFKCSELASQENIWLLKIHFSNNLTVRAK